jgi:hypothetical protein
MRVLTGTGTCPIYHRDKKPWHVPAHCPLLKELNLKLIHGPPSLSASAPAQAPALAAPTPAPSPEDHAEENDGSSSTGSSSSGTAPSGMTPVLDAVVEYDSDEDFCWAGDEEGLGYCGVCPSAKSNASIARYSSSPSCNHVQVEMIFPKPSVSIPRSAASASQCIFLLKALHHLLGKSSQSSIVRTQSGSLFVANTGATDHMTPDKSVFISYKAIADLQVCMGNNSFVPVLGCGTAIFSLNSQRVLVQNVFHDPGLTVPLYSLRAHLKQPGCGFFGTFEAGMLVYIPTFVLSVDTSTDYHLSYEPLGCSAPLSTLHYVQPWCALTLYPSDVSPSTCSATPAPAPVLAEDNVTSLVHVQSPLLQDSLSSLVSDAPSADSPPGGLSLDISSLANQLRALADTVHLMASPQLVSTILPVSPLAPSQPITEPSSLPLPSLDNAITRVTLLSTMPHYLVVKLPHNKNSTLPSICPCDSANTSDTKTHWTAEELHRIMGCRKFQNYTLSWLFCYDP